MRISAIAEFNWKYVLVGMVRRRIPQRVLFTVMKRRGDANLEEESPHQCLDMWENRLKGHGLSLASKAVLEIGSGRYARFALQMIAAGVKCVITVDPFAIPINEPTHRKILLSDCEKLGLDPHDAFSRLEIINNDFTTLSPSASSSQVDLVISNSVLEHVRDPKSVLRSSFSWLKPGGMSFHLIDLRDHNFRSQYPFEMLTYSDSFWENWLDLAGGFHLNRWRLPDFLCAAREVGFQEVGCDVLSKDETELTAIMHRIQPPFVAMPQDILAVLMIALYGQKPIEPAVL